MSTLLDGIQVVELTEALAGPYCAMMLGDFGADVIKVERPGVGDHSRTWGPPFIGSESAYFLSTNRNKRSITLNYDHPKGLDILHRLVAKADVFVCNQPSLEAEAGAMSFTGEPGGEPMRFPIAIADMTTGMYAAMGILAALYARERTGHGDFLDMALFDSQLTWLANIGGNFLNAGVSPTRWGNAHPSIVPYQLFQGSDARSFVLAIGTQPQWHRLLQLLDLQKEFGNDSRFATNAERIQNRDTLIPVLQQRFAAQPTDTWVSRLMGADIPAAPVQTVSEALNDPQTISRSLIVELEHPALKAVRSIANPIPFEAQPVSYRLPPPMLGEHNRDILRELRLSDSEIEVVLKSACSPDIPESSSK
jgi:crotonobetainyl-CoA:carnitine CoA-transferase CaiB-like acyl-CoA transferase